MAHNSLKVVYDKLEGKFYVVRKTCDFSIPPQNVAFVDYWNSKNIRDAKYGFSNLTLVLTSRCNLACDYCWQIKSNLTPSSPDISVDLIEYWLSYFLNQETGIVKKVVYYGGEPLLRGDLIKFSTDVIKRIISEGNLSHPKQHIFTNGTLLNKSLVKLFHQENIFPIISIDGNREFTDKHRRTVAGKSLWESTIRGIELLKDEGVPFGIACTVEHPEFDFENIACFIVEEIQPQTIEFNLRHDKAMVSRYKFDYSPDFSIFGKAWDLSLNQGIRVVDLSKRVKPYIEQTPLENSSSGCKNKLAIMPNGKVSPFNGAVSFPEFQFFPDDKEGRKFFQKIWNREIRTQSKCNSCEAIFICGQGSAFSSYLQFGQFYKPPVYHCEYSQYILDYIKQRILTKSGLNLDQNHKLINPQHLPSMFSFSAN